MVFKDIKNFNGLYKISDDGKVLALKRKVKMPNGGFKIIEEHYPKLSITRRGYLKVMLTNSSGTRKGFFLHRLVASAFIKNKDKEKIQVNHIDFNKTNNCVSNLEWITNKENCKHYWNKERQKYVYIHTR